MRRGLLVLLTPLMFSAALVAQTQVGAVPGEQVVRGDQILVLPRTPEAAIATTPEAVIARVSPDDVVARMLTFDSDRDGKVVRSELAERMQPLMARADKNRDGALDVKELRAIAAGRHPSPQAGQERGVPFASSYGFADEELLFSSLNHIEDAIQDLRLAADTREQARSIAKVYVDKVEADAETDLVRDLSGVLTQQQIAALQESLRNRRRTISTVRSQNGINRKFVATASLSLQPHIDQFRLSPDKRLFAQKAVDRYTARIKMSDAERVELVERMRAVLNAEERGDLSAALARRPVVAKDRAAGQVAARARVAEVETGTSTDRFGATIRGSGSAPAPAPAFGFPSDGRPQPVGR